MGAVAGQPGAPVRSGVIQAEASGRLVPGPRTLRSRSSWRRPSRAARNGYAHYGFGEALESIYPEARSSLAEFRDNEQNVWFTGHSLGGALAMLSGARMYLEEPRLAADGVYTYGQPGQPRVCDRLLAATCNKGCKNRMYRFVNDNDIVPQMPRSRYSRTSTPCATSTPAANCMSRCRCSADSPTEPAA
ncbi:lipase family protein [Streptomyces sp. 058-1L]|uniref:lipase family protein n=1 Tax=Streptomyces sp. 058-1L TaxID=2789266 RepID=UPI003980F19C